jgi:hypothetical protein
VLGDGGEKIRGGEDFKVTVNLGVETRAIDDHVGGRFKGHLFHREGIAENILGEVFKVGLGFRGDRFAGVDVEAAVFPGVEDLDPFRWEEPLVDKQPDDLGAEEFFQGFKGDLRQEVEGARGPA